MHLVRGGARVLLADRARFPRDKPCGGGVTGRALRQAPCDITPVVEHVVDTFELRLHHRRSFRRRSDEPLIVMTQRRRLDAYLAQQAAEAGAELRDGARVADVEVGEAGVTATVGGERVSAGVLVGADGANGVVAKAVGLDTGIVRGVALEGNVPWELLDRARYTGTAVVELGSPSGGYGWLFPKGDHANLGVGGWASEGPRLRTHLAQLARTHEVDPGALTDLRGHRLPMRRVGAATPAVGRVVLVGDAAGLVDPLSGDGMYEAFVSARLAAEAHPGGRSRPLSRLVGRRARQPRRRVVGGQARARPASERVLLGRTVARCVRRRLGVAARRRAASERGQRPRPAAPAAHRARRAPLLKPVGGVKAPGPAAAALRDVFDLTAFSRTAPALRSAVDSRR